MAITDEVHSDSDGSEFHLMLVGLVGIAVHSRFDPKIHIPAQQATCRLLPIRSGLRGATKCHMALN